MPATSPRVLQTLGENCFYAFSAPTNTPYEFENTPDGHEIAMALARALCQGNALPLHPPQRGRRVVLSGHLGLRPVGLPGTRPRGDRGLPLAAQGLDGQGRGAGPAQVGAAEADRILHERLDQCYVSRSPMWMPGVSPSMIGWTHARELKARMTISLPGARFGGMLVYPRYLTLEFRFMRFLRAVVLEACKEIQARKEGRTEGQVQVVTPDDEARRENDRAVLPEVFPTAAIGLQHRAGRRRPQLERHRFAAPFIGVMKSRTAHRGFVDGFAALIVSGARQAMSMASRCAIALSALVGRQAAILGDTNGPEVPSCPTGVQLTALPEA